MKNIIPLIILLFVYQLGYSQTIDALEQAFSRHDYEEAIKMSKAMENDFQNLSLIYDIEGRSYVELEKYDSSLYFLEASITIDRGKSYISAWSYAYLGRAYMKLGQNDSALKDLKKAVMLNKTKNATDYAEFFLNQLKNSTGSISGSKDQVPVWQVVETENIIYYFEDTNNMCMSARQYISKHETAYQEINAIFEAKLPQKLQFYIWNDGDKAKKLVGFALGFTNPVKCVSNVRCDQTVGHEMTHTLSYWGWGQEPAIRSRFINEGIAVALDGRTGFEKGMGMEERFNAAKKALYSKNFHSVLDIWKAENDLDEGVVYPVAGAFMAYMYKYSTPQQFKDLMKNQSMENAYTIYGKEAFNHKVQAINDLLQLN